MMEQTKNSLLQSLENFLIASFRFLASLKLAICVLVSLMIVLAAGTIIESLHGAVAARVLIYNTSWFTCLLLLLGVNVAASAADRYPWKKRHAGFVITHLGILVILFGSLLTQKAMIDGQMAIFEGEESHQLTLSQPTFYLWDEHTHNEWLFELRERAFNWKGDKTLLQVPAIGGGPGFQVKWVAYAPKAQMEEKMVSTPEGPTALKILMHNSFVSQPIWLREGDPQFSSTQVGLATLSFSKELLSAPAPAGVSAPKSYLELNVKNQVYTINLPEVLKPPVKLSIEGTSYEIEIQEVFQNAMVNGGKLTEQASSDKETSGKNPALKLLIRVNGVEEKHTVFAKFPDFPTIHGMKPSESGIRVVYHLPEAKGKGKTHELHFADTPEGLQYQIQTGDEIKTKKLTKGEDVALGWMGLNFKTEEIFEHSQFEKTFSPGDEDLSGDNVSPAMQVRIQSRGKSKLFWLVQGVHEIIDWEGLKLEVLFGEKTMPAGFRLKLRDFRLTEYPGTNNPASFESDVTLIDDTRGISKDATISMNQPLDYRGFKIYQSGYSLADPRSGREKETSVFSVGRDPGVPFKYVGTIVMIVGVILMFYFKSYSKAGGQL